MEYKELYTVVPEDGENTVTAEIDVAGSKRKYPRRKAFLKKLPYSPEEYARLTAFVSDYGYMSYELHTEWVGSADPTPYDYESEKTKEPVLPCDVVVKDNEVYGLLKRSPYREEYQIVTKDCFDGCHFSFRDPDHGDADNRYYREHEICPIRPATSK